MPRRAVFVSLACLVLAAPAPWAPHAGAAGKPSFLYVHDDGSPNQVFGFQLSAKGKLSALPGSPYAAGGVGEGEPFNTAAYSKRRKMLFVTSTSGIAAFTAAVDGSLTLVPGSPFGGMDIASVAVGENAAGTFVYGVADFNASVVGFEVRPDKSLAPAPASPYPAGDFPVSISIGSGLVAVGDEGDNTLHVYRMQSDGSLAAAPGSPVSIPGATIFTAAVDPTGRSVYVPDQTNGTSRVFGFSVNAATGALSPLSGSPFKTTVHDFTGAAASARRLALMGLPAGSGGPDLQVMPRASAGKLKKGKTKVSGLNDLEGLAFSPTGKFLVVGSHESQNIRSFAVAGSGALKALDTKSVPGSDLLDGIVITQP